MRLSRHIWVVALLGSLTSISFAQNRQFTMAQATNGFRQELAPEKLKQFEWIPGKKAFTRVVTVNQQQCWVSYTLPSLKADTLLKLADLNSQLFAKTPLKALPALHWLSENKAWFAKDDVYYIGTLANNSFQWLPQTKFEDKAENITFDKTSQQFIYTVNHNLVLRHQEGQQVSLTTDGSADIVYGQSVHRDEFGIDHGLFFSPKGNKVAYYRMDQSMVTHYPIPDWTATPARVNNIRYPMAGDSSHQVTLAIHDAHSSKTVYMATGKPADQYLTCVSWSPDEASMYIALLNREQNHLQLNQYDATTGALLRTVLEEKNDKYVHPMHSLQFIPWNNDQFIWWSERDGFDHLYLYNTKGEIVRQLTKGNWLVNDIIGFNSQRKEVIYTSSAEGAMEKHIYAVSTVTGQVRKLTTAAGWHDAISNSTGEYILDTYSSGTTPYVARVTDVTGKWQQNILTATDPLAGFQRPTVRNIQLQANDGTPLYAKMILPVNFDSTKQYPVIVYLYNGPGIQLLHNSYPASGNLWYEYMAQHGFIVFTMDGRGSSNRGLKFEQATFRHLGTVEIDDQLQGVAYLKSLPYVNASRMGLHGWSFGGFMTTSIMLRQPGVFKAAVAGGPVIDWRMYEVMYTERYMDTPQENPAGYAEANLLTKTPALQGNLMLIHGTSDDVVVWQHSIDFIKACVDNGKQVDYFVYPGHLHNVYGKDRVHLMQKITDYFTTHL
ncbi:dipeptidyl-peptidase-4 [Filimonas lacunae]|uniref:Dipeptidyl-peptidase-4 n=1 Tax=Filimonas lacunae TaxID=477680 RepID=A0A173MKJ4_9BACT|nr:DPP IV N-terminal domain-containing protein [Filimonas lacunae]BAV08124.1 dipeptidyl peptidase IV [Filimonas lacunae]SIT09666.1 dipeptidyl-peptidase-4 [Filimonas lacunae]